MSESLADAAEIRRLRSSLRMVLENQGGHQHWDGFGTAGANCPICKRQQEAAAQAWEVLKGLEEK